MSGTCSKAAAPKPETYALRITIRSEPGPSPPAQLETRDSQ